MTAPADRPRLRPSTFQLPVERMRDGYYSDAYFTFTREVLEGDDHRPRVLMQVFQREHKKGTAAYDEYKKQQGHEAKRLFRERWAKAKYKDHVVGKSFERSWQTVDRSNGELLTFGAIVLKFGGWTWKPAIIGAKNLTLRCAALGGKWIHRDEWSGLHFFLVLSKEYEDLFHRSWSEFEKCFIRTNAEGSGSQASVVVPASGSAGSGPSLARAV